MNKRERNRNKTEELHKKRWLNRKPVERQEKEAPDIMQLMGIMQVQSKEDKIK